MATVTAYLGLGSNLGDREAHIRHALERLGAVPGVALKRVSTLRETAPVGGPPQGDFLNGVAEIETSLPPHALLALCQALEREAGRRPAAVRDAPRPLDLDVLLFGGARIDTRELVVPHPRLHEREFVMTPLRELGVAWPAPEPRPAVVETPAALRARTAVWRAGGCSVGMVPTMGALHDGHVALVARARSECDRVVVTVFVNPRQFGAGEDFDRYPRTLDADLGLVDGLADAVFVPAVDDVYPPGFCSEVAVGREAEGMEGAARPGHFRGVATVVCKLWNLVAPDRAYFGRKDAQQVAVLRRLHRDLGLSGELVECATVRGADGVARSSRNAYLVPADREAAVAVPRALHAARAAWAGGERRPAALVAAARAVLDAEPRCSVDYVELRGEPDLEPCGRGPLERARMLVAVRLGSTRLIDNASLHEDA